MEYDKSALSALLFNIFRSQYKSNFLAIPTRYKNSKTIYNVLYEDNTFQLANASNIHKFSCEVHYIVHELTTKATKIIVISKNKDLS